MTIDQLLAEVARALGYGTFGLFVGLAVTWRKTTVSGYEVWVPTPRPDGVIWRRVIGGLLVIVGVLMIVNSAIFASRQSQCNEEFRRVIKERGDAATEQSELWSQLERELARIGPVDTPEEEIEVVEARIRYVEKYEAATEKRRANPYPDPRC